MSFHGRKLCLKQKDALRLCRSWFALGLGNTAKANAEGETNYTLSFVGETTNMIKDGWTEDNSAIADDILTLTFSDSATAVYTPGISLKTGKTYIIKTDIKSGGNGMGIKLWETGKWSSVFTGGASADANAVVNADGYIWTTANWATISVVCTPAADITSMYFQGADTDVLSLQLKNFTISEKLADDITVTAGAAIGNLPAVPEKEGYVGHWEIDGKAISSATVYDFEANKAAVPAYEKAYTLSFYGEPTDMIKGGWAETSTITDGVLSVTLSTETHTAKYNMLAGVAYKISFDYEKVPGDIGYASFHLFDGAWATVTTWLAANETQKTFEIEYTPKQTCNDLIFQWAEGDKDVKFSNFTITEIIEKKVFTAAGAIGELPAIPEKTGYFAHWELDGEEITAETNFAATENKVAKVVYEKALTLTYEVLPETDMIKEGWSVENTIENNVMTVNLTGETHTAAVALLAGSTYKITFNYQKVAGENEAAKFHLFDGSWGTIASWLSATGTQQAFEMEYTPTKSSNDLIFQWAEGDKGVMFSNFTISGYVKKQTLKAGEAVGTVPAVVCGTNYRAYWKIGDVEVTADTTITQDEVATLVIEYNGHVFRNNEFVFVEAKNTTKVDQNTATYAIKYNGTEEVESWSGRNAEDWSDGQFTTQKLTLKVKKADGTERTIVSDKMQLHNGELWFSFTSKVFGDIAEITIPAGEYKLTDGTGFKLEEITFYMVHYNCGLNEKVDYTVEHVAEVEETCTTDGCLDYYYCAKCGRYYEDADCTAEIKDIEEWKADEEGGLIEKLGHDFETVWSSDAEEHWHKCKNCDEKADKAEHADGDNDNKCDTCGAKLGSDESSSTAEDDGESGCASDISTFSPYLVIMLCAALCVIILRKRQSNR